MMRLHLIIPFHGKQMLGKIACVAEVPLQIPSVLTWGNLQIFNFVLI